MTSDAMELEMMITELKQQEVENVSGGGNELYDFFHDLGVSIANGIEDAWDSFVDNQVSISQSNHPGMGRK